MQQRLNLVIFVNRRFIIRINKPDNLSTGQRDPLADTIAFPTSCYAPDNFEPSVSLGRICDQFTGTIVTIR